MTVSAGKNLALFLTALALLGPGAAARSSFPFGPAGSAWGEESPGHAGPEMPLWVTVDQLPETPGASEPSSQQASDEPHASPDTPRRPAAPEPQGIFDALDQKPPPGPARGSAEKNEEPGKEKEVEVYGPQIGLVDKVQANLSERIRATALWMDSFFEDERSIREENHSYIRFRYEQFQEEGTKTTFKPYVDLRLRLPQLQEKTHLVLSAEQTETPPPGAAAATSTNSAQISNPEVVPAQAAAPENRNATAALHYAIRSSIKENITARGGAQFSHKAPVLFGASRYRSLLPFYNWNFRFTQEVVYRTDTLWQTETILDLERELPRDFFFRTGVQGAWQAGTNGYFYNLGFSLGHQFGRTQAIQYSWVNSYATRPTNQLTQITLAVLYRRSFWREWLYFGIIPQVRYPRDRNFEVTPGLLLRFEVYFGDLGSWPG